MKKRICLFITFFVFLLHFTNSRLCAISFYPQSNDKSLKINVVCVINGVGTQRDYEILKYELTKLGHEVRCIDSYSDPPIPSADINIFIQDVREHFFSYAKLNYFIPNPEWYGFDINSIRKFDLILCRTKEVERIFQKLTPHIYFLGFTSIDRYQEGVSKDYSRFLHAVGKSIQKGTDTVYKVWRANPNFPLLITVKAYGDDPKISNIKYFGNYLPEETIINLYNNCGIQICTSETEGFGHYIIEGMSSGAVIVTTDAPPMNEFINDQRCLVKYSTTKPKDLAINYYISPIDLKRVVLNLLSLPKEELESIGKRNRQFYLDQKEAFRENLKNLFGNAASLQ